MANLEGDEFKKLKPFFALSKEFEFDPVICFYLKQYAISKGLEIFKKMKTEGREDDSMKQTINNWISELETYKKSNAQVFEDKEKSLDHLEEATNIFFNNSDEELRSETYGKNTILGFQSCAKFFEILDYLGRGSEDNMKKRKYSLAKAVEVNKRLKNPELYQKNQPSSKDAMEEEKAEPKPNIPNVSNYSSKKQPDSLSKYQIKPCQDSVSRLLEFIQTDQQFSAQVNEIRKTIEKSELEAKRIEEQNNLKRLAQKNNEFDIKKREEKELQRNDNYAPPTKSVRLPQDSKIRIHQSNLKEKIRKECDNGINNLNLNKIGSARSDLEKALKLIEEFRKL